MSSWSSWRPEVVALELSAHGRSDVGQVRAGNEDALLILQRVFAVADGMGGHLGGEVASAAALEPLTGLDAQRFDASEDALAALSAAVALANTEVSRRSRSEPELEGMGTTLTALLIDGTDAHLVHVGDSRCYLLRDGVLVQLTDDHTLVQALIDQGRITRDEASGHPHRSVITRAIGVGTDIEVDGRTIVLAPDDVLLLCSDGLTGVVDDDEIAAVLTEHGAHDAVDELIMRANAAGGPDNITVLTLAVRAAASAAPGTTERTTQRTTELTTELMTEVGVQDADTQRLPLTVRISTDQPAAGQEGWAQRMGSLGEQRGRAVIPTTLREGSGSGGPARARLIGGPLDRMVGRILVGVVTLGLLLATIGLGAQLILDRSYLVGVADEEIVIFRGFDVQLGPIDLLRVHERPGVRLEQVPVALRPIYLQGRPAADLGDARRMVDTIPLIEPAGEVGG
jgi:PPM family protein phosphatase